MSVAPRPSEGIYRRVTVRMYGDERFTRLSPLQPSGQALWLYLLTGPHTGPIPGVFVAGRAALAETLAWDSEAFAKAFAEVLAEGLVLFDEKTRLCFIPNAIRHNAPPNPNVVKSWRAHWLLLPECPMREQIREHILTALTEVSEAFGKAFEEACGKTFVKASGKTLPKTSPKHMAKQEAGSRKQEAGYRGSRAHRHAPLCRLDTNSRRHRICRQAWRAVAARGREVRQPLLDHDRQGICAQRLVTIVAYVVP